MNDLSEWVASTTQLPLFLAVLHQDLLGLTSTSCLIMQTFKHRHCLFYFLYQFFFFIKQTNVLWFFCFRYQCSALIIALLVFHVITHEIIMVASKILLDFYDGFWGESRLRYSCLHTMLYFRINRRLRRWSWHCWDDWGHFTLVFELIVCYTAFKELHRRKYWEICFFPSPRTFLSLRIYKVRFGKQERVI